MMKVVLKTKSDHKVAEVLLDTYVFQLTSCADITSLMMVPRDSHVNCCLCDSGQGILKCWLIAFTYRVKTNYP